MKTAGVYELLGQPSYITGKECQQPLNFVASLFCGWKLTEWVLILSGNVPNNWKIKFGNSTLCLNNMEA